MCLCSKLFFRQGTCVTLVELNILVFPYAIIFTVMDDQEPVNKLVPKNESQLKIIRKHRNRVYCYSNNRRVCGGCANGVTNRINHVVDGMWRCGGCFMVNL